MKRWRDSRHLELAVETAGGQDAFEESVSAMMDEARQAILAAPWLGDADRSVDSQAAAGESD